jgi:hypothetical protein
MKTVTEFDGTTLIDTLYDHALTTVTIMAVDTGVKATGHAKWHETDRYDPAIGYMLARSRALVRYEQKMQKYIIKNLVEEALPF